MLRTRVLPYLRLPAWAGLLAVLLAACRTTSESTSENTTAALAHTQTMGEVAVWLTTADRTAQLVRMSAPVRFASRNDAAAQISIAPDQRYQRMLGFGAAITDASAWLIQHRMSPSQRQALLRELFGREDDGIGFDFTRLTIGASDFSRSHYSLNDVQNGLADPALEHFSIAANRDDVIPVTKAALAVNPQLFVMASPWSAPGWMKDSGSLITGRLLPRYYQTFARYLLRYVEAYAQEGIPISALTLQNEPAFEPKDYPGMRMNAPARAQLIGRHLGPMLAGRQPRVEIFDWDHNWDQPAEPLAVLQDARARAYIAGVAWHCYGGDVSAQSQVHAAFPDKDVYMTECSGGDWEPVRSGGLTGQVRSLIVNTSRHWARGILFWNLALDENGGPHTGGCDTCRGVVTINTRSGEVSRTDDYYALAHVSRFVRRGAWRVESSAGRDGLDNVAFINADDQSRVLVVVNSDAEQRNFTVRERQRAFDYTLPGNSVATFVWGAR